MCVCVFFFFSCFSHICFSSLLLCCRRQNIELGAVPTVQGRAVVFGNEMQHCVTLLYNPSKTEVAYRKIVCWFLVNPAVQIISTEDVPPQQVLFSWFPIPLVSKSSV